MDKDRTNIDLVKERTDIVSVVQKYVNLKQAGKNLSGLCPFHQENTPSFNVSPQLQIYKCFGCGKSGDAISFLQEIEKIDFPQALEILAKEAGVTLKHQNQSMPVGFQIINWAQLFYQKALYKPESKTALDYLHKRGITDKEIKDFGIGYSAGDGSFLKKLLDYKNFSKKILIESGLFIDKNNVLKEKFNKRIVFPILNTSGKVVAFTGRKLPGNDYGPKYLNSPESTIYQKRSILYGFYQAKGSIKREDLCILLEGQTDVISLHKGGYQNSVAPLGTGLTTHQLELILGYTKNILFIYDNDSAGQAALERSFKMATSLGFKCFSLNTGEYKDIDEFIQNEPEKLQELIEKRKDAFSYLVANKIASYGDNSLASLTKIESYINSLISAVSDETELSFYYNKVQQMLPDLYLQERKSTKIEHSGSIVKSETFDIEDRYLSLILNDRSLLNQEISTEYFENLSNREIYNEILNTGKSARELYESAKNLNTKSKLERLIMNSVDTSDAREIEERIIKRYLQNKVRNSRTLLAVAEEKEDTARVKVLMEQIIQLTNKLKNLKG